jgi:hypothetical protein
MPRKAKKFHADGEDMEQKPQRVVLAHQTIDDILGKQVLSDYEQKDEENYRDWCSAQGDLELQKECIRVGVWPKDNRKWNLEKLVERFHLQAAKAELRATKPVVANTNLTKEQERALEGGKNKLG